MGQFIDRRFYCKNPLGSSVASVSPGSLHIRINHIIRKMIGLKMTIKSQCLMSGQTYCRRPVIPVGSCIGKHFYIQCLYNPLLVCPCLYPYLHFMSGRGTNQGLISGINDFGRASCDPGDQCRIYLAYCRLLCTKTASDPWLDHPYL